ncbi:hypothetical protein RBH94_15160 [Aestuariibaculum sp. YM273]|uniref:hypothetical protein n=1 Tax=Aestuariibaculum sp. YM273 TaxID=3070659 RepID=UPI0027DBBFE9|nr:hypothetical protein [Aestuariibaculum sp. YM273]WMI65390.1 hypothetical protein RBH94_15160 [Aestuariibaculum sp. YM273]
MQELVFDLTSTEGIKQSEIQLLKLNKTFADSFGKVAASRIADDIKSIFNSFFGFLNEMINNVLDIVNDNRHTERQMKLAQDLILKAREMGAKKVTIIIDKNNDASIKAFIKEVDANIKASKDKGGKIEYVVEFN